MVTAQNLGPWNLDDLYEVPAWKTTNVQNVNGFTSILYESIDYLGTPAEVYAYYSAPEGVPPNGGWPAVVFVHGGGGTAVTAAVSSWNAKGYAALSMDLEGHYPNGNATPKPGPARVGAFDDYTLPFDQQWYYHAVAQVIKANSLIASFPEVNANKIGILGASWGGVLTSTVIGLDNRLAFAVPVYGSGYVPEIDTYIGRAITNGAKTQFVNRYYDGSAYFSRVTIPTLWINGTNDTSFALTGNQKSSRAVNGKAILRYSKNFGHSNLNWTTVKEVFAFANQVINNGVALPDLGMPTMVSNTASVSFSAAAGIDSAALFYTTSEAEWSTRIWVASAATISGNKIIATVPSDATTIYFTTTDSRGYMISSEYFLTSNATDPNPGISLGKFYFDNVGNKQRMKSNNAGTDVLCTGTGDSGWKGLWDLIDAGNGNYYIENAATQTRLQGTAASDQAGVKLVSKNYGGTWVQWKLTQVGSNWFIDNVAHGTRLNNNSNNQVTVGSINWNGDWVKWKLTDKFGNSPTNKEITSYNKVSNIKIYPNPVSDSFQINNDNIKSVEVHTISGKLVKSFEESANFYSLYDLDTGVYLVKIRNTENTLTTAKLVKL
ncbi:hypothetical protein GCM10022393_16970 [Aquimarina addita]|uniref:Secretion system C-terminal sorting domain-containing protein n=2 Tax=Aquimarina addita TaxID=870485 RepID=A0ABP7XJG4_9FLAO